MMKRIVSTMFVMLLLMAGSNAQTPDSKWGIGVYGGANQYSGDFGNGFYRFDQPFYGFVGLSVARNITQHWDAEFNTTYGEIGHVEERELYTNRFLHRMFQFNFVAKYNFFKYDNVRLRPFVFAGMGYASFDARRYDRFYDNFTIPVGAGLNIKVSPTLSVVVKETFIIPDGDNIEMVNNGPTDVYLQHSVGIVFNIGRRDKDKDGVADRLDRCPQIKGSKATLGCPDSDGDGIADDEDSCPDQKGPKETHGCPDLDGDGVPDHLDQCSTRKGPAATNGCPDTDGDGIPDHQDKCPQQKGPQVTHGCPDSDGDGLADHEDRCPQEKGSRTNGGCPEVSIVLDKDYTISFQTGSSDFTADSYKTIDSAIDFMKRQAKTQVVIEGHADSKGSIAVNKRLSQKRADAVRNYIISKGISAHRITAIGKGSSMPVATNDTAEGRAENRRAVLRVK
ncbi:OmpA family protein [Carboxylicivirga sp. RSCT41]|uniref:OmpA family protein n=1 Tax=Carboxylicivirga agarovorans TaxID=3417570 RepID=UPI003D3423EE